jgi:hypothetical protein
MVATGFAAFAATLTIGFVWLQPSVHGTPRQPELTATTATLSKTRASDTISDCSSQQVDHSSSHEPQLAMAAYNLIRLPRLLFERLAYRATHLTLDHSRIISLARRDWPSGVGC